MFKRKPTLGLPLGFVITWIVLSSTVGFVSSFSTRSTIGLASQYPQTWQPKQQQQQQRSTTSSSSHLGLQSLLETINFPGKEQPIEVLEAGVGPEGCKLPAPSGVNTLPQAAQAKVFAGVFAAMFLGTQVLSSVFAGLTFEYEWFQTWRYTWPLLGAVYVAAGIAHFPLEDEFANIYPPKGTWGLWYLPGNAEFHVRWTGVAEVLGGLGLLVGGAMDAFFPSYYTSPTLLSSAGLASDSAAALFLLTIAVTPSNVYMYTHGARLPMDGPDVPIVGHAIRGAMQVVLLALLYQMGAGTFDAWFSP